MAKALVASQIKHCKHKGVFNYRWDWVQELRDQTQVTAVKVATDKNLADLYTIARGQAFGFAKHICLWLAQNLEIQG